MIPMTARTVLILRGGRHGKLSATLPTVPVVTTGASGIPVSRQINRKQGRLGSRRLQYEQEVRVAFRSERVIFAMGRVS